MYYQRLANQDDSEKIAPLWKAFLEERSQIDPSFELISNFDYPSYVKQQLERQSTYGFLLEYGETQEIVGFLWVYVYDETILIDSSNRLNNPFIPRRVGSAIALYTKKEHRKPQGIELLIEAAMNLAETLKISDIDLLVSIDQTGIHKLLEKSGFTKSAIQYTKHYHITETNLPSLQRDKLFSQNSSIKSHKAVLIPLKDPQTKQPVLNPKGEPVFLHPLKNQQGDVLESSSGLPIYPIPLRKPDCQDLIFNESGELVTCPVVLDTEGNVIEYQGIPQFKKPIYEQVNNILQLKRDAEGNYLFEE